MGLFGRIEQRWGVFRYTLGFQTLPVAPGGILDTPVAVKNQTFGRFTAAIRHIQGCQRQPGIDSVREGITDDLTCAQVFDNGQIEPAFPGGNVGNISHPGLIGPVKGKVPLQKVGRNGMAAIGMGRRFISPPAYRGDPGQPHLPVHPFAGAAKFRLQQPVQAVQPHGRILLMQFDQPAPERLVLQPAPADFLCLPAVIPAAGYLQNPAYLLHRGPLTLERLDAAVFLLYGACEIIETTGKKSDKSMVLEA